MTTAKTMLPVALFLLLGTPALMAAAERIPADLPILWPEAQRAFVQDGPGLLLDDPAVRTLLAGDRVARQVLIDSFLDRDPLPERPGNELVEGIERRRALAHTEFMSLLDDRAKLLFLHGVPQGRTLIDCIEVYKPLEIWRYPRTVLGADDAASQELVLYRPKPGESFVLWHPIEGKRVLYSDEMEYFLDQWEENRRFLSGKRFDHQLCEEAEEVDRVTGIDGLFGFLAGRPTNPQIERFLAPPEDLDAWAARAAATELLVPAAAIGAGRLELAFPEKAGLRMETHFTVVLPPEANLEPFEVDEDQREIRLTVEGELHKGGRVFDTFRMRFSLPPPDGVPVALVAPVRLRPHEVFLARLKVVDEISGAELRFNRGFQVPAEPMAAADLPPVPAEAIIALGERLREQRVSGYDSLVLLPPEADVIFGLWRAEALVTGSRITKVAFLLDGQQVFKRGRPPFTAELRLAPHPVEQVVRAEGYDAADQLVASDEVVLNQPRGQLQVRILAPARGNRAAGTVAARVEVVVPEERVVTRVSFSVNEVEQAVLERPPWETSIEVPSFAGATELNYLTVTAELDDGSVAEDVRFLNPPDGIDEVDVNLVELFTTVTDRSGRLVRGLAESDFAVHEDGRPQTISKFELVEDLPLTLGIVLDSSGSMFRSMAEAQRAAIGFLENIITPRDRCFAVAFADRPTLLMPRTADVGAVSAEIEQLLAYGSTSLHDAVVTSLYYFRGNRGRRALVLLSDGEDTSSTIGFNEALEYARLSGVAIYAIGLRIGATQLGVRRKLEGFAEQTGGRTFYIKEAEELRAVYQEIEDELRSQYLIAYSSDQAGEDGTYRTVEVEVRGRRLEARTIRGYYQ